MTGFFIGCLIVIVGLTVLAIGRMRYVERRTFRILEQNQREIEAGLRWRMEELRRNH